MPPFTHLGDRQGGSARGICAAQGLALHVKFIIAEVVQMAPGLGVLSTQFGRTIKINAPGGRRRANRELFILRKNAANGRSPVQLLPAPTRRRSTKAMASRRRTKQIPLDIECPSLIGGEWVDSKIRLIASTRATVEADRHLPNAGGRAHEGIYPSQHASWIPTALNRRLRAKCNQ